MDICYVCGNNITSSEFYYTRGNAKRHGWHGYPGTRPYIMDKPTLKTAFEWAWSYDLAIVRPNGFDPIKKDAPRVTDLITSEAFDRYGRQLSTLQALNTHKRKEEEPHYNSRMTMGPFNRGR